MSWNTKLILTILITISFCLSNSYINDEGQLIVDGEPLFIMGMFADHYGSSYNSKMATVDSFIIAGFNTIKTSVMGEAWQTNGILNYANSNDIKLIYDGAQNNQWKDFHLNAMKTNRYHPGLLGWYIVDDSHGVHPDSIKMYHDQAKELDSNHITTHSMALSCWNDYGAKHIQERIEYCDVLQMQSYPIGKEPIDEVYRDMRKTIEAAEQYEKPVVIDLQLFNWKLTGHDWGRWPTEKEAELMTWLAIVAGVDGYLYYTYNDNLNPPAIPLSKTKPELWKIVKETARKVNILKSDFLHHEKFYTKNPLPNRYYGQWITKEYTTIIAINTSATDSLYFNIPLVKENMQMNSIFQNQNETLRVTGRFLKGNLSPMSVQFYRLHSQATNIYREILPEYLTPNIFPNPFNNATTIEFYTQKPENIKIDIFNLLGQKVRTISDTKYVGHYQFLWNGNNDYDNSVPSGVYFCHLKIGNRIYNRKILLLK